MKLNMIGFSVLVGWMAMVAAVSAGNICTWTGSWNTLPANTDDAVVVSSGGNLTWSNTFPWTVASWTQEATYQGTVTVATVYQTGGFTNFAVTDNVTLLGGAWTHLANSGGETNRLSVTVGGNLTVSNATIRADGLGYTTTTSPGYGAGQTGAAHGGAGGGPNHTPNRNVYGSITAPVNLGSRGGGFSGGGAILLTVAGTTTLESNGVISAAGTDGNATGGGSGGSIFLTTGWLVGSGTLQAKGSSSSHYGGGGGGRVAIVLTGDGAGFGNWSGSNTAFGIKAPYTSAAGTVYLRAADGTDTLIIDNNNVVTDGQCSTLIPSTTPSLNSFSSVVIKGKGVLAVQGDTLIDFNSFAPTVFGPTNSYIAIDSDTNTTYPSDWTIAGYTLYPQGISKALTNMTIGTSGALSHYKNYSSEVYRVNLTLAGNLTIVSNGVINANGLGCDPAYGPGQSSIGGAAHGGLGGNAGGRTYGSVFAPTNLGSGTTAFYNGQGGGAVILNMAGAFTNHGTISADGTTGGYNGGSGGSVYITAGRIAGAASGVIRANGIGATYCGGGGGRVAVVLTGTGTDFGGYAGKMTALGGSGAVGAIYGPGAAGTVYQAVGGTPYGAGTVLITNTIVTSNTVVTTVPADLNPDEDLRAATWLVRGNARLSVSTNFLTAQIGYLSVTGTSVRVDLRGRTLSVLPKLNINGALYELGSYAPGDFAGGIVVDSVGGGLLEVRPELDNANGATAVSETTATLSGNLYADDVSSTTLFVLWGKQDAGTNISNWTYTNTWSAPQSAGAFSTNVTPPKLLANTVHYYRLYMTNSLRKSLASSSSVFMTANIRVEATANAAEAGLTPGAFTFYRHPNATNGAITIGYSISGSANPGINYVNNLGTSITFAAGESEETLTVTPIQDDNSLTNETLILTLAAGPYGLGTPSCVTALVENAGIPAGPTNVWLGGGNASQGANWSLGHAPTNTETVFLSGFSKASMVWDVTNTVTAWTQTAQYTGMVTLATVFPGKGVFTNLHILGNMDISGGMWTHLANTGDEANRLCINIGGNLNIGSNVSLAADGLGYTTTTSPGYGAGATGAAHGGAGGGLNRTPNRNVYGSVIAPTNLGSRGGNAGASGGGAILLTVAGTTTLQAGSILTAAGTYGNATGGGSGGSIYLTTGWLVGSGTLQAKGSSSSHYGGGGGGRVAIVLTGDGAGFGNWSGSNTASGVSARPSSAAGTVYLRAADGTDTLIIDNNNVVTDGQCSTLIPSATPSLNSFSNVVIKGKGVLAVRGDTLIDFNTFAPTVFGPTNSYIAIDSDTNTTYPSDWTIAGYTLYPQGISKALTNMTIGTSGALSHYKNYSSEVYRVNLTLAGNLMIVSNGSINVDGLGHDGSFGPGAGGATGGGGHGGLGGNAGGNTYGSVFAPNNLGSGTTVLFEGGGGGAVILHVAGAFTNHGTISANGSTGNYGGGSGGSVYITAGRISGAASGVIRANGIGANYCGGGGGRVAVVLTGTGTDFGGYAGKMTALGGSGGVGAAYGPGAAGTVYQAAGGTPYGAGTVWITNSITTSNTTFTSLPAFVTSSEDLSKASWIVQDWARITMITNATIASLTLNANSYLELSGYTLTTKLLTITNLSYRPATYTAAQLGGLVTDSSGGAGKVVMTTSGTCIMMR